MDVAPFVEDGRTMVPIRFIAEALGATISSTWVDGVQQITIIHGNETISFLIGQLAPGMDVPAQIIDSRTFVPIRFVAEALGASVIWNSDTQTVEVLAN